MPFFYKKNKIGIFIFIIKNFIMSWKLKEEFIGLVITNCKKSLDKFKPHQIENLPEGILNKYFDQDKPKRKKKDVEAKD